MTDELNVQEPDLLHSEGDMEQHITRVTYEDKELILIATAHVSKASAELVKQVIDREKPDSICVELDEDRYNNMKNPKAWSETDLVQVIKDGKVGFMFHRGSPSIFS